MKKKPSRNPHQSTINRLENAASFSRQEARSARQDWVWESAETQDRRAEALEFAADWLKKLGD